MKKCISILMSILITFSITGCNRIKEEVEKLAIVLAMGYDMESDDTYTLTAQILNVQKQSSGNTSSQPGNQAPPSDVMFISAKGKTPFDAINNISDYLGKKLFFAHSQYVIIGSSLANHGVSQLINTIIRNPEARPNSLLLLTKGKASKIITTKTFDTTIPANSIKDLIKLQSSKGLTSSVSRLEFANAMSSKTTSAILDVIDRTKNTNDEVNNIIPIISGKNIAINITIKQTSNILEMTNNSDPMKNPKVMDELGILEGRAIKKEVKLAINKAQKKLNADIFNFGGILHRSYPKVWKKVSKNWRKIFPNIKVKVNVISNLDSPGKISKPIKKY